MKPFALYVANRGAGYFGRHRLEEHETRAAAAARAREMAGELGQNWLVRLVDSDKARAAGVAAATFAAYEGRMTG